MVPLALIIGPVIGALGGVITAAINRNAATSSASIFSYGATSRLKMVLVFIAAVIIIGGIGTGSFFLVKNLFFNKQNTVSENVAIVEAVPVVVPETEMTERETSTEITASAPEPAAKTGFFQKVGEFFAGIGRAIKGFFIMVGNAIKTFFINVGAFFTGIFGKFISLVKGLFNKNGG